MFGLGFQEIILVLIIVLVVFGPKRLPELARTIGRAVGEIRRVTYEMKQQIDLEASFKERGRDFTPRKRESAPETEYPESGPKKPDDASS